MSLGTFTIPMTFGPRKRMSCSLAIRMSSSSVLVADLAESGRENHRSGDVGLASVLENRRHGSGGSHDVDEVDAVGDRRDRRVHLGPENLALVGGLTGYTSRRTRILPDVWSRCTRVCFVG